MIDNSFLNNGITLYMDDCFNVFPKIPDESIDMILCDLPYGITACKWDSPLDIKRLWKEYKRIIKPKGAILLTATQPFASRLIMENPSMFKYEWIWDKVRGSGFQIAKYRPIQRHENILCFCKSSPCYFPIMETRKELASGKVYSSSDSSPLKYNDKKRRIYDEKYPQSIIRFNKPTFYHHPTQKPIPLFEYLIKTYSRQEETILDNCFGSGTTAIACIRLNRKFIGIESEQKYFVLAKSLIKKELSHPLLISANDFRKRRKRRKGANR